jgi:hypothetical protein
METDFRKRTTVETRAISYEGLSSTTILEALTMALLITREEVSRIERAVVATKHAIC